MKMIIKRIRIGKKAIAINALIGIIIALISFVLLATTIGQFMSGSDVKQQENLCQSSISLRATTALQLDSNLAEAEIKTSPVLCKTIDIKSKTKDREEIKRLFAEKIAKCWWMFGEGRYNEILTGSRFSAVPSLLGINNEPNECFNCYNIMIDQDEIEPPKGYPGDAENLPILTPELIDYLWENHPVKTKTRCRPNNEKLCQKELAKNFPSSCKDDSGYDCLSCEIDSDCNEAKGDNLKCERGICEKQIEINYLQYIQSYGGPGMFVNILDGGIQARHAYSISILPKTIEKEQGGWLKWVGVGIIGVGVVACVVATSGICASVAPTITAALATGSSVAATTTVIGAKVAAGALAKGVIVAGSGVAYEQLTEEEKNTPKTFNDGNYGQRISVESMFKERLVTSVYLSETKFGQAYCGTGDLGGE